MKNVEYRIKHRSEYFGTNATGWMILGVDIKKHETVLWEGSGSSLDHPFTDIRTAEERLSKLQQAHRMQKISLKTREG